MKDRSIVSMVQYFNVKNVMSAVLFKEYNPPMWFIPVLYCFALLYPVIIRIIRNIGAAICVIIGSTIFNILLGVGNGYSSVRYWVPIYLIGAVISYHCGEKLLTKEQIFSKRYYCTFCMILLLMSVYIAGLNENLYYLYRFVFPVLLYLALDCIVPKNEPKWYYRCSLFIFGMHIMVIAPVAKVYFAIVGYGTWQGIASNFVLPIMNALVILFLAWGCRKCLPFFWRLANGGR